MDCTTIANESGGEIEDQVYYFRKRAKLSNVPDEKSKYVHTRTYRRKNPMMFMPTEILHKILAFLTNDELARSIRLVNRRFRIVAQLLLNHNFIQLKFRLNALRKMIADSVQHTHDDIEIRCLCKMLGVVEILIFYHSMLTNTIWRYIYFKRNVTNICMYGGIILDKYNNILKEFLTEPHKIYSPIIIRDYTLPRDVKIICHNAKSFALYFDRVTEMPLNDCGSFTGCKILDILDTAINVKRTVVSQKLIGNTLTLKLNYFFSNSWFVALDISNEKTKVWNEQQRLMYMRLRRIVISHSEMAMEYDQFRRETLVRSNPISKIRKPINSVYTGYGEVGDKFFYYGVMNEGAYINKFINGESTVTMTYDSLDVHLKTLYLGLDISVELRCPLQLAPYKIIEAYEENIDDFVNSKFILPTRRRLRGLFELKVDFQCPSAVYPRLPVEYTYYVRNQK